MSYIIGIDISEDNTDFSAATIAKVKNGVVRLIDSKTSKDSEEIKEFVKQYEPEYFTTPVVSGSYSNDDLVAAYNKGWKDGYQEGNGDY